MLFWSRILITSSSWTLSNALLKSPKQTKSYHHGNDLSSSQSYSNGLKPIEISSLQPPNAFSPFSPYLSFFKPHHSLQQCSQGLFGHLLFSLIQAHQLTHHLCHSRSHSLHLLDIQKLSIQSHS